MRERFGNFEKNDFMSAAEEKRDIIIRQVKSLSEEQLDLITGLLTKIDLLNKDSVEYLFAEAVTQ